MDKQKIGFVGALIIVAIAIVGGIVLAAYCTACRALTMEALP
jgi:hypothetical protein